MVKNRLLLQKVFLIPLLWLACFFPCNLNAVLLIGAEIQEEDLSSYVIGAGDKLEITVFRNTDLDVSPQVDTMGEITFPLLGGMKASGLTPYQVRDRITEGLRKYITNPQVTVNVSTYQSQKITIMGEVESPGVLQIEKPQPIYELISKAGGFTENSNKDNVTILRKDKKGARQILSIDMRKMLEEGDTSQNILIYKDDIIYIPKDIRKITVLGEVNSPGTVDVKERLGILEVITKVGGFTDYANKNNIIIMGKNDKSHVRILDYQQILDNKDLSKNIVLSDGEVVYVPRENKQVLLLGEIQNPGIVNNDPPQTLLEAITRRGGVTSDGNKSKVVVIRGGADKASVKTYNLKKIVKDGDMSQNIILQKGDIIYIPPTFMASTENVLNHVKSILSVALSAESAITFWPQTRQVLETGKSSTGSSLTISPGQ